MVVTTPWLWISIVVVAITNVTLAGPYQVAIPFLVKEHYRADVRTLGILYAAFPVGYIIGGVWIGRFRRVCHRGWTIYLGIIVAGLGMLALGLPISIVAALLAAVMNGAALEIGNLIWVNLMQELTPNERLSRISSIEMLGSYALLPVGVGLTGWATDTLGPATVCIVGGGLTVSASLLGLLHPAIRELD